MKWDIKPGFLTKKQEIPRYPTKLELFDLINRLRIALKKQKDPDKKAKLRIMIEEFNELRDSL